MEEHYLTVKQLRDFLNNCDLPDDTKVFTQRLEDKYVEKHGWTPLLKEGEQYIKIWGICQCPEKDGLFLDVHY